MTAMSTTPQHDDINEGEEVAEETLEEQLESLSLDETAQQFLASLVSEVEDARAEAEDAYTMVRDTRKQLRDANSRIADLEDENRMLRDRLDDLDTRTTLLQTADTQSRNVVERRAAALLQTLFNQAWRDKQKDNSKATAQSSMDYNSANMALGGGFERSQLYAAMKRAVTLVHPDVNEDDNKQLAESDNQVRFIRESRSSDQNTRLLVDLTDVDRLETTLGKTITPPTEE